MKIIFVRLRVTRVCPRVLALALAIGVGLAAAFSGEQSRAQSMPATHTSEPFVVQNDIGGDVGARANQIATIMSAGQHVEIRGPACYSSCTMYLGLPGSCVNRHTQFGFHGPSFYGTALSPDRFEFWSKVIAAHYPPVLRSWYLREARYSENLEMVSGAEIIRLGVQECS